MCVHRPLSNRVTLSPKQMLALGGIVGTASACVFRLGFSRQGLFTESV